MSELPNSWAMTAIENVLAPLNGKNVLQQGWSPQCENFPASEGAWGVLKTTAIQEGAFLPEHNKQLPTQLEPRPQLEIVLGDLLMTCAGPRSRCGVACLVKSTPPHLMMSGKIYRFRANQDVILPKYLELFLLARDTKFAIDKMKTGINDSGLNLTHDRFSKLEVFIAPLNEQHRIVAKIEELFSELDQGIEALKTAREQLKVYRQALLKHAFEGKLTAPWRAANPDKLEPAASLLARIQAEREQRYQQQLRQWQVHGGSKPKAPKPLPPLSAEELAELPELPEGWGWVRFNDAVNVDSNLVSPEDFASYPHIAPDNIERETGQLLAYRTVAEDKVMSPKHRFFAGQIIYSKIRPNLSKLVIARFDGLCSADMYPLSTGLNTNYLFYLMLSKYFVSKASNSGSRTVLPKINQQELGIIPLPICCSTEQEEIVKQLAFRLSEADQLELTLATSLQQAEALRQSILKRAFSGRLVPQDPGDEPAAALLARIQAERMRHAEKPKKSLSRSKRNE